MGRPKGATSFVTVNMAELNKLFGPAQGVPVSRVWLKKLGIEMETSAPKVQTTPKPASDTKIEMTLES